MVSLKSSRCPFCDTLAIVTLRRFAHSVYMRLLSIDIICLIGNIISLSILYTLYLLFLFPQQVGIFNYYRYKYICYLLHDRACYARHGSYLCSSGMVQSASKNRLQRWTMLTNVFTYLNIFIYFSLYLASLSIYLIWYRE